MSTAASLLVNVGANVSGATAGLGKVESQMRSLQATGVRTSKTAGSFGKAMKTGALVAVGGLAYAVKGAVDFERSMRNVNSIAHLSEGQFKNLGKQVLSLGKSTGQAPKVLADGLYDIVSSGFKANDAIKILATSAKAATAGMTDTATASKGVVAVLNAYHLGADKAANVSSLLFEEVNKGVNTFEELAQNIGDTAPAAAALKIPFSEVAAGLALITKHGTNMAEASTQMGRVLQMMLKPSEDLKTEFHNMGYESGQAAVKALGFTGVLNRLSHDAHGSATQTADWAKDIRALRAMLNLTGPNLKEFNSLVKDMGGAFQKGGADTRAFNEQSKSVAVQWMKAKAAFQAVRIEFGAKMLPVVTKGITWLSDHMPQIKHGLDQMASAFKHVKTFLDPVAAGFGGWAHVLTGLAIGAAAAKVLRLTGAMRGLSAVMGGIGSKGGIFTTMFSGLASKAGIAGRAAGALFSNAFGIALSLGIAAAWMAVNWSKLAHQALAQSRRVLNDTKGGPTSHQFGGQDVMKLAQDWTRAGATISQVTLMLNHRFGEWGISVQKAQQYATQAAHKVEQEVPAAFNAAGNSVKASARKIGTEGAEGFSVGIKKMASTAKVASAQVGPAIASAAGPAKAGGQRAGSAAASGMKSGVAGMPAAAKGAASRAAAGIHGSAGAMKGAGHASGAAAVSGTKAGLAPLPGQVRSKVAAGASAARGQTGAYASAGSSLGSALESGIIGALGGLVGAVVGQVTSAIGAAMSAARSYAGIHSPSTLYRDKIGKPLMQGIVAGITSEASKLTGAVRSAAAAGVAAGNNKEGSYYTMGERLGTATAKGYARGIRTMRPLPGRDDNTVPFPSQDHTGDIHFESRTELEGERDSLPEEIYRDRNAIRDLGDDISDLTADLSDANQQLTADLAGTVGEGENDRFRTQQEKDDAIRADRQRIRDDQKRLSDDEHDLAQAQAQLAKDQSRLAAVLAELARRDRLGIKGDIPDDSREPGSETAIAARPGATTRSPLGSAHNGTSAAFQAGHFAYRGPDDHMGGGLVVDEVAGAFAGAMKKEGLGTTTVTVNVTVEGNLATEDQFAKSLAPKIRDELVRVGGRSINPLGFGSR